MRQCTLLSLATSRCCTSNFTRNTAAEWNRLSPYEETMRTALPRYIQMLHQQLHARTMPGTEKIAVA